MNSVNMIGRLTDNVAVRTTASGTNVANFTVAVDDPYKRGDEKVAYFIPCTAWSGTATFVSKYFTKGQRIGVTGRLATNKWVDKEGNNRTSIFIQVENVDFADGRRDGSATAPAQTEPQQTIPEAGEAPAQGGDDLPF